ncbi:MAG: GAF domain-containing sensor histidine kinase [Bryobacterales bacterium]|nr:GAF domain-containing sensor histidine kinase [Bryobacterales bacterium]
MGTTRELHFPQFASLQRAAQIIELVKENLDALADVLPRAEQRFHHFLATLELGVQETKSIRGISLGSVLNAIRSCYPSETVLEEIEYQARRLAKLQVDPAMVHTALSGFDQAILEEVEQRHPAQLFVTRMIVNHYHLFVTNVINVTLYQLWRADSKLLEDMSAVELAELSERDLRARIVYLVKSWSGADAVAVHASSLTPCDGLPRTAGEPAFGQHERWPAEVAVPLCIRVVDAQDPRVLAPRWRSRYRSVWSFPIVTGMRLLGVLQLGFTKSFEWLPSEAAVLLQVTERLGLALTRCELVSGLSSREAQVRQLATHLQLVEERERKRISRELHDEAGQSLLCLRLQLEMIENGLSRSQRKTKDRIRSAREQVESIIVEIRRLLAALSPNVLEQFGLVAAIRHLLKEFVKVFHANVEVAVNLPEKLEVSNATSMVVYRFVQECLHNILSHAQADTVKIQADFADGWLRWQVKDNGVGFELGAVQDYEQSFGLRGISERIFLMGGTIDIATAPGSGTTVTANLPLHADGATPGLSIPAGLGIPAGLSTPAGLGALAQATAADDDATFRDAVSREQPSLATGTDQHIVMADT